MKTLNVLLAATALTGSYGAHAEMRVKFPLELHTTRITDGVATVAWTVSPDGRIEDAIVLDASHPAFGRSALDALPKRLPVNRAALASRYEAMEVMFKRRQTIIEHSSTADIPRDRGATQAARPIRTVTTALTDSDLTQINEARAICPDKNAAIELGGTATIRFVVDQTGRVRVPYVTDSSSNEFAALALAAVKQWQFEPPLSQGAPVQVEEMQTLSVRPTRACVAFRASSQIQVASR